MPPKVKMPPKQFALTRWLCDESVGVMPFSALRKKDQVPYVGAFVEMKYLGKFYDAEILKISENRQALVNVCDDLTCGDVTREELLQSGTNAVDSTTDSEVATPVKRPKVASKKPVVKTKKATAKARVETAKSRAKEIFASSAVRSTDGDNNSSSSDSASDDDVSTTDFRRQLALQQQQIENLKRKLQKAAVPRTVTKNIVAHSTFDSLQKNIQMIPQTHVDDVDTSSYSESEMQLGGTPSRSLWKDPAPANRKITFAGGASHTPPLHTPPSHTPPSGTTKITFAGGVSHTPPSHTPPSGTTKVEGFAEKHQDSTKANQVELAPGYGIYIAAKQLDEVKSSGHSPTKLIRNLLTAFFEPQVLAASSALGSRKNPALNKDILDACFRFVQQQFEGTVRTILVDATNDKCAQCRRKNKGV